MDTANIDSSYDLPAKEEALAKEAGVPLSTREEYLIECAMKKIVDVLQRAGRI